ncbi:MAG: glycosyltransferase [Candidatus Paceibacterota bacterium]|jgi:GT2 family glycosyltransferase/glycosyltransferase involved in cell wall biosynthesis
MHTERYETIVLIPSFNGKYLLEDCLRALEHQTYRDFHIILADDASTDDTREYVNAHFPSVEILALPHNCGFSHTVNAGLIYVQEKYNPTFVAILNNDTRADTMWLESLIVTAKTNPTIAAVTSNMFFWNPPHLINSQGGTLDWNGDGYDINFGLPEEKGVKKNTDVLGACWGASLINMQALQTIGLLDETFGAYFEDLDWSWRANIFGYRIVFEKKARIFHRHSASYRTAEYRKLLYCKRNALRSAIKNYETKSLSQQISYILIGYWFSIVGYFQTSKHQLPLWKKIKYSSIPFIALLWNIFHLPSTLHERATIQKMRKKNDAFIFTLIAQDATPVREWLKQWQLSPTSKKENGAFLSRVTLQTQYRLSLSEIHSLEAVISLVAQSSLFDSRGTPSPLFQEINEKTIEHFLTIALQNLPFIASSIKKNEMSTFPSSLVIDACFFSFGLSLSQISNRFAVIPRKIEAAANAINSNDMNWDNILTYAHTHNALSQLYFYFILVNCYAPNTIPEDVLLNAKKNGSHLQNILIQTINYKKLLRGKSSLALYLYLKMYFNPGIVRAFVARFHALYNGDAATVQENNGQIMLPFGVNIFGFLDSESGVGEAARALARAVQHTKIPYALLNSPHAPHRKKETQFSKRFGSSAPYAINLISIFGDMFAQEWDYFGKNIFENHYNIACWTWELETLPPSWIPLLERVQEVWVPSSFAAKAIQKARNDIPIHIVPYPIEIKNYPFPRAHFNIPSDKFVFLFMFDFYSYFERKNPLAIIRAFTYAFPENENVRLVIKCSNASVDQTHFDELQKAAKDSRIQLINTYLDRGEVNSLINVCDAYISLHRSEGFGLTMAEAMALRKPVIGTDYSSNTDFMNEDNSFPVHYSLIPIKEDHGVYTKGNFWAEPDVAHAAEQMRIIYENPDVALRKAMFGARDIAMYFSPSAVAQIVQKRLHKLRGASFDLSPSQKEGKS